MMMDALFFGQPAQVDSGLGYYSTTQSKSI